MSRKRILYVTGQYPAENASQAGHKTAFENLRKLASSNDVDVIIINSSDFLIRDEIKKLADNVFVYRISSVQKIFNVLRWGWRYSPKFAAKYNLKIDNFISNLINSSNYSQIFLEFTEVGVYFVHRINCPYLIISAHDVIVQWSLRVRNILRWFTPVAYDTEHKIMLAASHVIVQSVKDKNLIESFYGIKNISVSSPKISNFLDKLDRKNVDIIPYTLLFWGAMSRSENYEAIFFFLKEYWPSLKKKFPFLKIYIVGSDPPAKLKMKSDDDIIVTGFIEDPSWYFKHIQLGIVPLINGAGIKVKVLEMLSAGMPVVASPVGAEGIDSEQNLIVANLNQEFFDAVSRELSGNHG